MTITRNCLAIVLLPLLVPFSAFAAARDAEEAAAFIGPYLSATTAVIVQIDLERVEIREGAEALANALEAAGHEEHNLLAHLRATGPRLDEWVDSLREAEAREMYLLVDLADLFAPEPLQVLIPLTDEADAETLRALLLTGDADGPVNYPADTAGRSAQVATTELPDAVVRADTSAIDRLRQRSGQAPANLAASLESVSRYPVRAVFAPSADLRRVMSETRLEDIVPGAAPTRSIAEVIEWASVGLALPPDGRLSLSIQSRDASAAQALKEAADATAAWLRRTIAEEVPAAAPLAETLFEQLDLRVDGDHVSQSLAGERLLEFAATALALTEAPLRPE